MGGSKQLALTVALIVCAVAAGCLAVVAVVYAGRLRGLRKTNDELARQAAVLDDQNRQLAADNNGLAIQNNQLAELERRQSAELQTARPAYAAMLQLASSLKQMRDVWIEHQSISFDPLTDEAAAAGYPQEAGGYQAYNERSCEHVLRSNLWVLAPDLVPLPEWINDSSHMTLRSVVREHFGVDAMTQPASRLGLSLDWRPDICGWFDCSGGFQSGMGDGKAYVIVELNHSQEPVRRQWMDQCYAYALTLMYAVPGLWGQPIQCFVIGAQVPDDVHEIQSSFGGMRNGMIRVTPLTYKDLFKRATEIARVLLKSLDQA